MPAVAGQMGGGRDLGCGGCKRHVRGCVCDAAPVPAVSDGKGGGFFWRVCVHNCMAGWAGAAPFGWPGGLLVLRAVGLVLVTTLVQCLTQ